MISHRIRCCKLDSIIHILTSPPIRELLCVCCYEFCFKLVGIDFDENSLVSYYVNWWTYAILLVELFFFGFVTLLSIWFLVSDYIFICSLLLRWHTKWKWRFLLSVLSIISEKSCLLTIATKCCDGIPKVLLILLIIYQRFLLTIFLGQNYITFGHKVLCIQLAYSVKHNRKNILMTRSSIQHCWLFMWIISFINTIMKLTMAFRSLMKIKKWD